MKNKILLCLFCLVGKMAAAQTLVQEITSPSYIETQMIKSSGVKNLSDLWQLSPNQKLTARQFLDGNGRVIQEIYQNAGKGTKSDLVAFKEYNAMGGETRGYLPYAKTTQLQFQNNRIADQQAFYAAADGKYAKDAAPYAELVYENSPMQRILQEGSYGANWQIATGKVKSYASRTNTSGDQVRLLKPDGTSTDFYGAGLLDVNEITDEEGQKMLVFTDRSGQVILKRQLVDETIGGVYHQYKETYYVYAYSGLLNMVLPPKVVAAMKSASWALSANDISNNIYQYVYDDEGKLTQRKAPSAAWIYIIYDKLNRPVLMQNDKLRAGNKWSFTKYDQMNRPVMEGVIQDNSRTTYAAMQSYVLTFDYDNTGVPYCEKMGTTLEGYTNLTFPTSITANDVMSVYYYDTYDLDANGADDYTYTSQSLGGEEPVQGSGQGNLTILKNKVVGTQNWLQKIMFYNARGEAIQVKSNNILSAALNDIKTVIYNFDGTVKKKISKKNTGTEQKTIASYNYDVLSRLSDVTHQVNSQPAVIIAQYNYNELGQLVDKNLGMIGNSFGLPSDIILNQTDNVLSGQTKSVVATNSIILGPDFHAASGSIFSASIGGFLQSVDYQYNIRGWLTKINNSALTADGYNEESNDVFGMELLYEQQGDIGNTGKYNGLITGVKWRSKMSLSPYNNLERAYTYNYDKLGQLRDALFKAKQGVSWNHMIDAFSEKEIKYDINGNITALRRFMWNTTTSTSTEIDQMDYTYSSLKHDQLVKVEDPLGHTGSIGFKNGVDETTEYEYDGDGNLTKDKNKGFVYTYNEIGKVATMSYIADASKYIAFEYTSSGEKVSKLVYQSGNLIKRVSFLEEFVYENSSISYVSHEEGRVRLSGGTTNYEYFIKDHLGNVRVSFENDNGVALVRQESSYYAFGMQHGPIYKPGDPNNELFNGGSEWVSDFDNDPDLYSTFFRNYDPVLGRFNGIDPMADKYTDFSVYNFAFNNPISLNDPSGADPVQDFEKVLEDIWRSTYGGNWTPEGGATKFESHDAAFAAGVAQIDGFDNGWDYTEAGHRERAIQNYIKGGGKYIDPTGIQLKEVKIVKKIDLNKFSKIARKISGFFLAASKPLQKSFERASLYSPPNSGKTALVIFEKTILGKRLIHQPLFEMNALKAGKYGSTLKTAGKVVGIVGGGLAAVDMYQNGVTTSNTLDLVMSGLAVSGAGTGIASTYFILNSASMIFTGKDIGQHIDSGVQYMKENY